MVEGILWREKELDKKLIWVDRWLFKTESGLQQNLKIWEYGVIKVRWICLKMLGIKILNRYEDTKSGYIKLYLANGKVVEEHRYIMCNFLGRELYYNEVVHHKDGNKKNNDISNLEVKQRSEHAKKHGYKAEEEKYIILTCTNCNKNFKRERRIYKYRKSKGQENFFCSVKCQRIFCL